MKRPLLLLALAAVAACSPSAPEQIAQVAQPLTVIPSAGGSFNGSTSSASGATNQYAGTCGGGSAREQVFQWTAPRAGSATFKTCNGSGSITNYDTVLYVRRSTLTGTELACNDDAPSCNPDASKITANVVACTTYFVFVDGWGTTSGNFTLTVTPPAGTPVQCGDAGSEAGQDGSSDGAGDGATEGGTNDAESGPDGSDEPGDPDGGGEEASDGDGSVVGLDSSSGDAALEGDAIEGDGDATADASDAGPLGPYPLRKQAGARYLVDQAGAPFLLHGDTAWSLMAQLTTEQADTYFADRAPRGVNSVIVSLTEFYYSSHPPRDAYGNGPFTTPNDFATPNPAYFDRADQVIQAAGARGIQLFLFPAYLGFACSFQVGWYEVMAQNGATKIFNYGAYLGARYRDFDNIVWVMGGDCDPPNKELVRQLALGIRSQDTRHLMTSHGEVSDSLDFWTGETWLDFDSVYNYPYAGNEIRDRMLGEYNRSTWLPTFLIESHYENESNATPLMLRQHAYEAILNGGMGQFFGNAPMWCFSSVGCYGGDWQSALNSLGAQDQTRLWSLFSVRPWERLVPDSAHAFITSGFSNTSAARATDGSWAAAYLTSTHSVTINLASFSRSVSLSWFNPSTGVFTLVAGSPFANTGSISISPPAAGDWVLLGE